MPAVEGELTHACVEFQSLMQARILSLTQSSSHLKLRNTEPLMELNN